MEGKVSKNFSVNAITGMLRNEKLRYILISGVISIFGFVKSFLFLRLFNFLDLGLINIAQNFIISISLLQIGIITGGYRLYCYKSEEIRSLINSAVLYFFFILSSVLLIVLGVAVVFFDTDISIYQLFFFVMIGVLSLYGNWVTCKILAIGKIKLLNRANLISAILSILIIFLFKYIGVWAALLAFLSQSLILILFCYARVPQIVPKIQNFNFKKIVGKVISIGFVPYLTTAMGYFNSQLGRWLITLKLGTFILGKTSIVNLFITVLNVFPTAISHLFYPTLIAKYEMGNMVEFKQSLQRYFLVLAIYLSGTILLTLMLSNFVVGILFPIHLESLNLVYAILPSLTLLCITSPIIVVLQAAKKFKAIFFGSLISVVVYLVLLVVYLYRFDTKLIGFFIIESISSFCFFVYNCIIFRKILKETK